MNTKGSRIRLSAQDLRELSHQSPSEQQPYLLFSWQGTRSPQSPFFDGRFEAGELRPGLKLAAVDLRLGQELEIASEFGLNGLVCVLSVEGSWERTLKDTRGRPSAVAAEPGSNVAGAGPAQKFTLRMRGSQIHRTVRMDIDGALLSELAEDYRMDSPDVLEHIRFPSGDRKVLFNKPLSPALQCVVNQILTCPMHGAVRRLFLESKAMEILAHELDDLAGTARGIRRFPDSEEFQRLQNARDILHKEFAEPPGLFSLARRVGLNDFKLKRGFREAFGTTVYGYVRELRLEMARALLEGGDLSVTQVALEAGYNSLGHFAALFRKRFGVLPSHYRSKKRRSPARRHRPG